LGPLNDRRIRRGRSREKKGKKNETRTEGESELQGERTIWIGEEDASAAKSVKEAEVHRKQGFCFARNDSFSKERAVEKNSTGEGRKGEKDEKRGTRCKKYKERGEAYRLKSERGRKAKG